VLATTGIAHAAEDYADCEPGYELEGVCREPQKVLPPKMSKAEVDGWLFCNAAARKETWSSIEAEDDFVAWCRHQYAVDHTKRRKK